MPFRLAIISAVLYMVCFSVGGAIYYANLQDSMLNRIDESLYNRHIRAAGIYEAEGIDAVKRMVEARTNNPMQSSFGYHLSRLDGEHLAGDVSFFTTEVGLQNVHADLIGIDSQENYRFYTSKIGDYVYSTGRSVQELEAMQQYSIKSFLAIFLVATTIALIGGSILASRSHSRVRSIVNSMDKVAGGNLNARLPISASGDDIDHLASNMNDALALLQQQIEALKQVSANIAHDLKTPLNRLYIKIEEAASEAGVDNPVQKKLDEAIDEAANINGTFEALLRISQIEAGARKSQFTAIDLLPTLQTAVEVYEAVAEEEEQNIVLQLDKSVEDNAGLHLLGDKDLLLQMVVNLLENAIRHCPAGTNIIVGAGVVNGIVWMSVCDNGPGIPEESRDQVFQRLFRLEASRTTSGSGLGLSLVKAVADLHCGVVTLSDNSPGLCVKVNFDLDCPVDY